MLGELTSFLVIKESNCNSVDIYAVSTMCKVLVRKGCLFITCGNFMGKKYRHHGENTD